MILKQNPMAQSNGSQSSRSKLFRRSKKSSKDSTSRSGSPNLNSHPQFNPDPSSSVLNSTFHPPDFLFPPSGSITDNPQLHSKTYQAAIRSLQNGNQNQDPIPPSNTSSFSKWNLNLSRSRSGKKDGERNRNNSLSNLDDLVDRKGKGKAILNPNSGLERSSSQVMKSTLRDAFPNGPQVQKSCTLFKSNSIPLPPRGTLSEQTLPYLDWALTAVKLSRGEDWQEKSLGTEEEEERYHYQEADEEFGEESDSMDKWDRSESRRDRMNLQDSTSLLVESLINKPPLERFVSDSGADLGHQLHQQSSNFQTKVSDGMRDKDDSPPALPVKNPIRDSPDRFKEVESQRSSYISSNSILPSWSHSHHHPQPQEEMETIQSYNQYQGGSEMERIESTGSSRSFYSTASSSAGRRLKSLSTGTSALFRSASGRSRNGVGVGEVQTTDLPNSSTEFPRSSSRLEHQESNESHGNSIGATPPPHVRRSSSRLRTISSGLLNLVGLASHPGSSPPSTAHLSPNQDQTPRHARSRSNFQTTSAPLVRKDSKSQTVLSMEESWRNEEIRRKKELGIESQDDDEEEEEERVLDSTFEDEDLDSENFHSSNSHQNRSRSSSFRSAIGSLSRSASQLGKRSGNNSNANNSPRQMFSELRRSLSRGSTSEVDASFRNHSRSGSLNHVGGDLRDPFKTTSNGIESRDLEEDPITPTRSSRLLSFAKRGKGRKDSGMGLSSTGGSKHSQLSFLGSYNALLTSTKEDASFKHPAFQETMKGDQDAYYSSSSNYVDPSGFVSAAAAPPPLPPKSSSRIEIPSSIDSYPAKPSGISPSKIHEWALLSQHAEAVESPNQRSNDGFLEFESESEREIRIEMEEMARREARRLDGPPQLEQLDFNLKSDELEDREDGDWELKRIARDLTIF